MVKSSKESVSSKRTTKRYKTSSNHPNSKITNIINTEFLTTEILKEITEIRNDGLENIHYLTNDSAVKIANLNKLDYKTPHQCMWHFLCKAIHLEAHDNNNATRYFGYNATCPLNPEKLEVLSKCFTPGTPLYLDTTEFFRFMVLGSGLMFRSSNEKLCLAIMLKPGQIDYQWSAEEIIKACPPQLHNKLSVQKIEQCLNHHSIELRNGSITPISKHNQNHFFYTRETKVDEHGNSVFTYRLRMTELILYFRELQKLFDRPPPHK